jgi:ATP-dependent helicase/DNAse subunit B
MRLFAGPPGSGKTAAILREARSGIERGAGDFRLVAPSSTMAEHLRNALARDGLAVRPSTIVTLSGLVASLTPEAAETGGEELALVVSECLAEKDSAAFASLRDTPGLARVIAQNIEDLANSGCGHLEWAALGRMGVWRGTVLKAFGEVWEQTAQKLSSRGMCLRADRIAAAAAAVRRGELNSAIKRVFVDGFFTFSRAEIELLRALDAHVDLLVTLPDWAGAAGVRKLLENQRCEVIQFHTVRAAPTRALIAAIDPQREAEEITLRVLEARRRGFAWREIGVILRAEFPYAPLIERAFARAGIPARLYFGQPLAGTAVSQFFEAWVAALLSGWEHRLTLKALLAVPQAAELAQAAAAFERTVIAKLPGAGLEDLERIAGEVALPGSGPLRELLENWKPCSPWVAESVLPEEWAKRLGLLAAHIGAPDPAQAALRRQLDAARKRASALRAVAQSMESAARLLAAAPITLEAFWRTAARILSAASLHQRDGRRDVVHVMDVYEARQWELPVVFVCGLTEGQFPRRASSEPLLGDDLRFQLQRQGFPVLTSKERDLEEAFLCEFAMTRATSLLTLSYPLHAADGAPALRAFFLDNLDGQPDTARPMKVAPLSPVAMPARYSLQDPRVLDAIRRANRTFKPTSLEDYLQCPFRFFARRTLRLREPAEGPEERLSPLMLGSVIHEAIDRWHKGGAAAGRLLPEVEAEWRRTLNESRIPASWRTETLWLLLERSARFYEEAGAPEPGWDASTELELSLAAGDYIFECRADRVDRNDAGQARLFEFKFIGSTGLRKRKGKLEQGLAIQAPLYALALARQGLEPVAYSIVALRGKTETFTCDDPAKVREGMEQAERVAVNAAYQITQGDIRVMPADPEVCGYCSYQHACRKREEAVAPAAEAES